MLKVWDRYPNIAVAQFVGPFLQWLAKNGSLWILQVNNAGIPGLKSLADDDILTVYDSVIRVNVRSMLQLTQLAIPHLTKTKGYTIINSLVNFLWSHICWESHFINSHCAIFYTTSSQMMPLFAKLFQPEWQWTFITVWNNFEASSLIL